MSFSQHAVGHRHTGIVDQTIDLPPFCQNSSHQLVREFFIQSVSREGLCNVSQASDFADNTRCFFAIKIVDRDFCSFLSEQNGR
jgi:hypothetical protein